MEEFHSDEFKQEAEQYKKDREKIRGIIGGIGGKNSAKFERFANCALFSAIVILFIWDILGHFTALPYKLPGLLSLEIGVLLVSIKIIRMIYMQTKVEHFQFWILNSIEFRINEIDRKLQKMEKTLKTQQSKETN
ncbi:hypothetical protein BVX94_03800 [bacterium B17]|nr:hypothetical protein BVX94_03800 [bacterium B17]